MLKGLVEGDGEQQALEREDAVEGEFLDLAHRLLATVEGSGRGRSGPQWRRNAAGMRAVGSDRFEAPLCAHACLHRGPRACGTQVAQQHRQTVSTQADGK